MDKTISLCMIVKDEEKHLRRCLDSAKDKVNEIIIVDTGSIDSTIDIARQYTSQIYLYKWSDDFAAARNYSIQYATSDYILILDADEYLDSNADLKRDLINSENDYYLMNIRNVLSYGGAFTHNAVRLFANNKGLFYQNRLHEHLNILDERNSFKGGTANTLIHHSGYTTEIMEGKEKTKRNLPLMLKEVEENPDAYNLYNMGKTYMSMDENGKAIKYFQRAYPLSTKRVFLPELLTKLAYCLSRGGKHEEGLKILNDAVILFPHDTELHFMQGRLFEEAGYNRDAEKTFFKCLELGDKGAMVTEGSGSYRAYLALAELYEKQNRIAESYDHIILALKSSKAYAPALRKYFEIVSKANIPLEDIHQNIKHIYNISNINELQLLLDVLYSLRHPLLNKYISIYSINVQPNVVASAKQYNKHYNEAMELWYQIEDIPDENGIDILLLSLLLTDVKLFNLAKPLLNLSVKEEQFLKRMILHESITDVSLNTNLKIIMGKLAEQLIVLQEYEAFEIVSQIFLKGDIDSRYRLGELLASYGFTELSIDLLVKVFEEQPNNIKVVRLLGDICFQSDYLDDAQLFYSKLLDLNSHYSSYERCYKLCEKLEDENSGKNIKDEIKKRFPLSNWVCH